jgi:transposase
MARLMLSDELWSKLRRIMLQHRIYDKPTLRLIVEAMLYRMRVGCPWRDLPAEFGGWNSMYQQFNNKFEINHLILLYHERKTQKQETVILIGVCINIAIWLKMYLPDSNIFAPLQQGMIN